MDIFLAVFVFLSGLVIGSFLNVCIYRIPLAKSIIRPRSGCMSCGHSLSWYELIPVVSFIIQGGKCRRCGARIPLRYPLVELLTAGVWLAVYYKYQISVAFVFSVFLMSILIAVLFIDLDHMIIPDKLVLTGIAGAVPLIVYNLYIPYPVYNPSHWYTPLLGMVSASGILLLVAVIGLIIYKNDGAMGMGDVKILVPIGIFLGPKLVLLALLFSIFIGGFSGVLLMVIGRKGRKSHMPFGPYIVVGTFISLLFGYDILAWYYGYAFLN